MAVIFPSGDNIAQWLSHECRHSNVQRCSGCVKKWSGEERRGEKRRRGNMERKGEIGSQRERKLEENNSGRGNQERIGEA
jgi:hypothetical protein